MFRPEASILTPVLSGINILALTTMLFWWTRTSTSMIIPNIIRWIKTVSAIGRDQPGNHRMSQLKIFQDYEAICTCACQIRKSKKIAAATVLQWFAAVPEVKYMNILPGDGTTADEWCLCEECRDIRRKRQRQIYAICEHYSKGCQG